MKCFSLKMLSLLLVLFLSFMACGAEPDTYSQADTTGDNTAVSTTTSSSTDADESSSATNATDGTDTSNTTNGTEAISKEDATTTGTKAPSSFGTKGSTSTTATTKRSTTTQFKPTTPKPSVTDGEMMELALNAYADLLDNWWMGDAKTGHFIASDNDPPSDTMWFLWEPRYGYLCFG